jgi:hypothetical protein
MAENASEGTPEVDRDVRADETHKHLQGMIPLNAKRTYDVYQQEDIEVRAQTRTMLANIQALVIQTMQNAVENANLAAKRSLDHWDKADVLSVANAGAAADAAIDQSPPDEGVRQAKVE